jgi:ABC-2 type transport system permease protein
MIIATIIRDVQLLLRDRGALLSMFALPLVFMGAFGFMFAGADDEDDNESGVRFVLALQHGDAPNESAARILEAVRATKGLEIRRCAQRSELDQLVAEGGADAGVVIPDQPDVNGKSPIVFVADPALSTAEAGMLQGTLLTAIYRGWYFTKYAAFIDEQQETREVDGLVRNEAPASMRKKREHMDSFQVSVPGNAVLFIFFLSSAIALSFVEDRRSGMWRRLHSLPVPAAALLIARLVPWFVIGMLQMLFLFGMAVLLFGMQISGSIPALVVLTAALVLAATTLGFLMASFGGSEKQVSAISTIVVLVMALLSGCMFPRFLMPLGLRQLGLAFPHGWALDGYKDILIREGTTIADISAPCLALLVMSAVFTLLALLLSRRLRVR